MRNSTHTLPRVFPVLALAILLLPWGALSAGAAGPPPQLLRYQVARLQATDAAAGDGLGNSIDLDGGTAVVGAPLDDDAGTDAGAAYLFEYDPGAAAWVQAAKLTASDGGPYHGFGSAVAVQGDTVAVGAYAVPPGGAVYLYGRDQGGPGAWGQVARITGLDTSWADHFGFALDLDGDTLLVGAYAGGDYDGRAYLFYRDQGGSGAWGQVAHVVGSDVAAYDLFGCAVALSGDTAVVGAPGHGDGYAGAAYLFQRDLGGSDAWGQAAMLSLAGAGPQDWFGYPVAIAGDTAAICAQGDGADGTAHLYGRDQGGPGAWGWVSGVESGATVSGTAYCASVALLGDTLAVGAPAQGSGEPAQDAAGAVYLFARHQGGPDGWGQVAVLTAAEAVPGARVGSAAALDGDLLAAGAPGDEPGGSAYLFRLVNTPPEAVELLDAPAAVDEGAAFVLHGRFVDPDLSETLTVTVAWGDGASGPAEVGGSGPGYAFTATHAYLEGPAAYSLSATVVDRAGGSAAATAAITVSNVPPLLDPLPALAGTAGAPLTATLTFSDPGVLDGHTAEVWWTAAASCTVALPAGAVAASCTYTYAEPGAYTVTVRVVDDDGGEALGQFAVAMAPAEHRVYLPVVWR